MVRKMYDSINANSILAVEPHPQMVAGYVDKIKLQPWSANDWALFPNAVHVQIVKKASSNFGHVLDVEPGDATPVEAPGWVRMRRAAGADPSIYCSESTWGTVQREFNVQNVAQPHYWIAHYDEKQNFPTLNGITAVAKQYHGNDPRNYDLSIVADYWPGIDGNEDMPLTPKDLDAIMQRFYDWRDGDGRNINDQGRQNGWWIQSSANAITQLTNLVIADDANDVTTEQVADAVTARILPVVQSVLSNVELTVGPLSEKDKTTLINGILDGMHSRLES